MTINFSQVVKDHTSNTMRMQLIQLYLHSPIKGKTSIFILEDQSNNYPLKISITHAFIDESFSYTITIPYTEPILFAKLSIVLVSLADKLYMLTLSEYQKITNNQP